VRWLLLFVLWATATSAAAVNVRGRVDFSTPNGVFPMNQAFVELCHAPTNSCLTYVTGYDGMYYFNAILGPHFVRINGIVRYQFIVPNVPAFDIPPLIGN
jgi:hypothetical protein